MTVRFRHLFATNSSRRYRTAHADIRRGAVFARMKQETVLETAQVVDVVKNTNGILHIRYNIALGHPTPVFQDGPRILALSCFLERFSARLDSGPSAAWR